VNSADELLADGTNHLFDGVIDVETDLGSGVRLSVQLDEGLLKSLASGLRVHGFEFIVFLFLFFGGLVKDELVLAISIDRLFAFDVASNTLLVIVILV